VCAAGCLPRKELFEAWEVARRVRRLFRGGRIVDLGGGHGLLAEILQLLDDSSPGALVVDKSIPPSALKIHESLVAEWPRLAGRITFEVAEMNQVSVERDDLVVASHACGHLTDRVLLRASDARARVAVLPCCHHDNGDTAGLDGWVDRALAIDIVRTMRLRECGYRTWTQTIPAAITPMNRLLLAAPIGADEIVNVRQTEVCR
jgi:hypothetical protein